MKTTVKRSVENLRSKVILLLLCIYYFTSNYLVISACTCISRSVRCQQSAACSADKLHLFRDLLSQFYVYHSVWNVIMADNFTSAKRDESFSAMFTEP